MQVCDMLIVMVGVVTRKAAFFTDIQLATALFVAVGHLYSVQFAFM